MEEPQGSEQRHQIGARPHELRNEIVEEFIADRVSESCAEQDAPLVRGGRTRGMESEKGRRGGESRKSQEKRPRCLHSEKQACPRRRNTVAAKAVLSRRQTERGSKDFWDAEQLDRDLASRWSTRIASQPLCPREARVRALRMGKDLFRIAWRSGGGRWQAHLDTLVSHELHAGAPVCSPAPISRSRSGAGPTRRGCSRRLIRRGFVVASPCH